MNRIINILFGVLLVIFGLGIVIQPRWYSTKYEYYIDVTGYSLPLGIAFMIIGIAFIYAELKQKNK
jgi:flagellar basal body-associated protein FliL